MSVSAANVIVFSTQMWWLMGGSDCDRLVHNLSITSRQPTSVQQNPPFWKSYKLNLIETWCQDGVFLEPQLSPPSEWPLERKHVEVTVTVGTVDDHNRGKHLLAAGSSGAEPVMYCI